MRARTSPSTRLAALSCGRPTAPDAAAMPSAPAPPRATAQSEAIRISEEIHADKISFNEAAFNYSEDKAGAHGLLGDKAQNELDPQFWAASLTCKEGDWLREPVKTQWGWHLIMVQARITKKRK